MSLITLNSNGQIPHFFSCHFPQAIKIKPNSQVCLLKFLHFRDSNVFNITGSNNRLIFLIGNSRQDAFRTINLPIGQYTGVDLATLLEAEMNAVLQQQNYAWTVAYTQEDTTTSPVTIESFQIVLTAATMPTPIPMVYTISNPAQFRQVGATLSVVPAQVGNILTDGRYLEPKGILLNNGETIMNDVGFDYNNFFDDNADQDATFRFNDITLGIVRDEISSLTSENINLQFNPLKQDASIAFNVNGIEISTINIRPGPSTLGSENYATRRICRTIPSSVLRRQLGVGGYNQNSIANTRYRARLVTKGSRRRVIITLQRSVNCGRTFNDMTTADLGTDPQGNPYVTSFVAADQTYQSVIWVSDNNEFNDEVGGANLSKSAIIQSRKAPFHPTVNIGGENNLLDYKDFVDAQLFYNKTGGGDMSPQAYNGPHPTEYIDTWIDAGDGNKQYFCVPDTVRNPTNFTDINLWHVSETDVVVPAGGNMGTLTYDIETNTGVITKVDTTSITFTLDTGTSTGVPIYTDLNNQNLNTGGIINPTLRPLTNMRMLNADLSPKSLEEMHRDILAGEDFINDPEEDLGLGVDVQKPVSLLLKMLNNEDIFNNQASPLYLTQNNVSRFTGTMGGILGSNNNLISVAAGGFPMAIYNTDGVCQKLSKDTIINVSINEFSGLKSFNGIDQSVGKNLSGVGKVLAVLPREEFAGLNVEKEGSLVYVAPFENWLDINNGQELLLNQLSVEVRTPAGEMATDLRPDTIVQIKIREDPHKIAEAIASSGYNRLIKAMSSATQTGQVLNSMGVADA